MKQFLSFTLVLTGILFSFLSSNAQLKVSTSSALPRSLSTGTNYSTCTNPGTKFIEFVVPAGTGVLNPSFTVMSVELSFSTGLSGSSCGGNFRDLGLYLAAPNGTCFKIYDGANATTLFTANKEVSFALRSSSCLNQPNFTSNWNLSLNNTGNYGFFASATNYSSYNGLVADGTSTLYAFSGGIATLLLVSLQQRLFLLVLR